MECVAFAEVLDLRLDISGPAPSLLEFVAGIFLRIHGLQT